MYQEPPFARARVRYLTMPQSFFGRVLTFVLTAVMVVLSLTFSLAILAVAAVVGLVVAGWFWWKTRTLRKTMQEAMREAATAPRADRMADLDGGQVIDGECVRETPDAGRPR